MSKLRKRKRNEWVALFGWMILCVPALVFGWGISGIAMANSDFKRNQRDWFIDRWNDISAKDDENATILAGERLLMFDAAGIDDLMRLFEAFEKSGRNAYAVKFLSAAESRQSAANVAEFRFRFAEKIIEMQPLTPASLSQAFTMLEQSLAGPLSRESEKQARIILANRARMTGSMENFVNLLKPVATDDLNLSTELVWTQWLKSIDQAPAAIRSSAVSQYDALRSDLLFRAANGGAKPTNEELIQLTKMVFIMDGQEDPTARIKSIPGVTAEQIKLVVGRFDDLTVIAEVSRKKPRNEIYASRLWNILNREDVAPNWIQLAVRVWATQDLSPIDPVRLWFQDYSKSDKTDFAFFMNAAQLCHANQRWDDARAMYEKALEKSPENVVALNNLAAMYYRFPPRDPAKALSLVDKALELSKGDIGVTETKAQILVRMGRYDEALSILRTALPVYPKEWNIHNTLSQIYAHQGNTDLAAFHADRARQLSRPPGAEIYEKIEFTSSGSLPEANRPDREPGSSNSPESDRSKAEEQP